MGVARNRLYVDRTTTANKLYSVPDGAYPNVSWIIPQVGGAMTAHNTAVINVAATANGVMGYPIFGEASFTISAPGASAELIAFGQGEATLSVSAGGALFASISADGFAGFAVSASAALGAEASISGEASISISTSAESILPLDDASPLRTGTASFAIAGALTPYAVGVMSGSTVDTGLSNAGVAAAVVSALNSATIPVDLRKVKGQAITGTGVENDPWGPA